MSLKEADVDRMWNKFQFDIKDGKDVHASLSIDGKVCLRTKRSKGRGGLDGNIPNLIRQQMRLSKKEFEDAVKCPLTRDQYLEILRTKGML